VNCWDHSTYIMVDTLDMARWCRAHPGAFCEECRGDESMNMDEEMESIR
jgi:hypothetical protein